MAEEQPQRRWYTVRSMRRMALAGSAVAAVLLGLVLLRPVLQAPITGDDVYYDFHAASDTQLWDVRVGTGRVDVITRMERRISGRVLIDASVASGRLPRDVLAVFRAGYLLLSLVAVYALLRTVRWRRRDSGELVRLAGRDRALALIAGALMFAAGAQAQLVGLAGFNGWVSYPVSTLTLPLSVFGVVALALWFARLGAERGGKVGVPAALTLLVVGGLTNYRYELTFLALPMVLIALVLLPVSSREHRSAGRRAKWLMGGAYVAGFVPLLIANRLMISRACARTDCYVGVTPSPGLAMFKTFAVNVVSSVPGTGRTEIAGLLRSQGVSTDGVWTPTLWSALAALVVIAVLAAAWWGSRPQPAEAAPDEESRHAQGVLCVVVAALLAVGGLGAAAIMALSRGAQESVSAVGFLNRNTPTTWFALAFGLTLLVLAVGLLRPRLAVPSFVALGLVLALLVTVKVPADGRITTADNALMGSSDQVFAEMVRGQKGAAANQRRCRILDEVDHDLSASYAEAVRRSSNQAFEHFWHVPFCAPA